MSLVTVRGVMSAAAADKPAHAADRLIAAIEAKRAPVCVGLDPVIENLPAHLPRDHRESSDADLNEPAKRICDFCIAVMRAVAPHVAIIKLQSACFERYGGIGVALVKDLTRLMHARSLEVILDAKRGDIGLTAEHYAATAFTDEDYDDSEEYRGINSFTAAPDWLTINSYLGEDGITPFLRPGHGAFALVRTSNPGGDTIQNLELKDGRTVAEAVGEMIARIGADHVGARGYSSLGAVVGATKPQDAKKLRAIMPQQIFLVPGYGAQGGGLDDVLPCFDSNGGGAIVTASRSIIYAFKRDDPKWTDAVADAAAKFADEVGRAVGMR